MNSRLQLAKEERDESDEEVRQLIDDCDEMLFDEKYCFAAETIQGIRDTVEKTQKVTEKQREAIDNIKNSGDDEEE